MKAIYPGSFDPLTVGHMEVIKRASQLFDHVYVMVLINPDKHPLFRAEQRVDMIERCIKGLPNVSARSSEDTLFEATQSLGADVILRGLRSEADYLKEKSVTDAFLKLWGIETLFLQCDPEMGYVSSSLVRELLRFHAPVDRLVPPEILKCVLAERSN
ncbi:pantetheine-phosphate adenylyltransferase [Eubacteriales bacterium OttesenSCG-928-N13]|nr:pantetheine-phosphate adenylyltransferase [Eubacteriales bacterium OttesenSCG-928-N13]